MFSMKEAHCRRMNNRRLRALLVRLQDRLSEDDRRRFNFFLGDDVPRRFRDDPSLGGTLCVMESLFDQDIINEQDFTFLINAFDEIQCLDAVKLLREHMMQIQSNGLNESVQSLSVLMPPLVDQLLRDQDEDKFAIQMPLINPETFCNNNNVIINSHNGNINAETVMNGNQARILPPPIIQQQLFNISPRTYLILLILSLILQVGVAIGGYSWIYQLKMQNSYISNERIKNNNVTYVQIKNLLLKDNDVLYHLKSLLSIDDETLKKLDKQVMDSKELINKLTTTVNFLEDERTFSEGKTCGCLQWCKEHGSPFGVCGNGHTCICGSDPITRASVGDKCRCDAWCERRNYTRGGICGDGYTCICTS